MQKFCYYEGCRFNSSHTTSYHKCGSCNSFGHGRIECHKNTGNYEKINSLLQERKTKYPTIIPKEKWCKVHDCKIKQTHDTGSHHALFSQNKYADTDGPDQYYIKATLENGKNDGKNIVKNNINSFTKIWWGMGNYIFTRNKNGIIETKIIDCDAKNEINNFTQGLREISN